MSEKIADLLQEEIQLFLRAHENDDEKALVLEHPKILGIPAAWIAEQLAGRRKAREKLPTLYQTSSIIYPPSVNLEQCSSESTAEFKALFLASALENYSTASGADLTGGFGIDSFFLSRRCATLDYVEPVDSLLEIASQNHAVLGATNIRYHSTQAEVFLQSTKNKFDFIFVDPSRRKSSKRVFRLADGDPIIPVLLPFILEKTNVLLIKASPMLDLIQGLNELKGVQKIAVVAVDNECKEVLFLCTKEAFAEPKVHCVNLSTQHRDKEEFIFTFDEEKNTTSLFSDPLAYLYEPNASILKAGAFKLIGQKSRLAKLHPHTHIYTSDKYISDFPGRIFKVDDPKPSLSRLNVSFLLNKANIISRNYPLRPEQLKKKLKLNDGGEKYLIALSGIKEKFLLAATRLK